MRGFCNALCKANTHPCLSREHAVGFVCRLAPLSGALLSTLQLLIQVANEQHDMQLLHALALVTLEAAEHNLLIKQVSDVDKTGEQQILYSCLLLLTCCQNLHTCCASTGVALKSRHVCCRCLHCCLTGCMSSALSYTLCSLLLSKIPVCRHRHTRWGARSCSWQVRSVTPAAESCSESSAEHGRSHPQASWQPSLSATPGSIHTYAADGRLEPRSRRSRITYTARRSAGAHSTDHSASCECKATCHCVLDV